MTMIDRPTNLTDAALLHRETLATGGRSPSTLGLYQHCEDMFLAFLSVRGLPPTLGMLAPATVAPCATEIALRAPSMAALFTNVMKSWAAFLTERGVYTVNPLASLPAPPRPLPVHKTVPVPPLRRVAPTVYPCGPHTFSVTVVDAPALPVLPLTREVTFYGGRGVCDCIAAVWGGTCLHIAAVAHHERVHGHVA